MEERLIPIDDESLKNVTGGEYGVPELQKVEPGQRYCPDCQQAVYPTINANGEECCPNCGHLFVGTLTQI